MGHLLFDIIGDPSEEQDLINIIQRALRMRRQLEEGAYPSAEVHWVLTIQRDILPTGRKFDLVADERRERRLVEVRKIRLATSE